MGIKRVVAVAAAAGIGFPLVLVMGVAMAATSGDSDAAAGAGIELAGGSLKVGKGGVPAQYAGLIEQAAADCKEGLPVSILAAQLKQESGFDPNAGSHAGAQGIAQFMPDTWKSRGVDGNQDGRKDVYDPADAIPAQGKFMCSLLKSAKKNPGYKGSPIELALAGYNAGWGAVERYRGVPPKSFARGETYNYVKNIIAMADDMVASGGSLSTQGWTRPTTAAAGTPYHQKGAAWSSGYHTGVDFAVPVGTPIKAAGPGTVVRAGTGGPYGNEVVIRHDDGMHSQYAHLSRLGVKAGQKVQGGQVIGQSGATGNVTGPHLHFEIRTGAGYGTDISPVAYLRKRGVAI